jgi:Caspase domain
MLNRRLFLGGLCASLPVIALPGALCARSQPHLHAMVVGINRYTGQGPSGKIPDLEGCINDANDIARQVAQLDSNVRVLGGRNEPVTRDRFFSAWQSMLSAARTGDTLLLTYSGHGGQVAEACAGNETDHLDETLILTGLDVSQNRRDAEHIIDDELAVLWAAAAARGLSVIFVADSCFSGTVYRNVELADRRRYRTIRAYQLAPGGVSPVSCQTRLPEDPTNLLFLAGSQENQVVPEMELNGVARGALSVAFARALEGGADTNRDGIITGDELTQFVLSYVESLADSNQHPAVWHGTRSTPTEMVGRSTRGALVTLRREETPTVAIKAPAVNGPPLPPRIEPVRLQIRGLAASERSRIESSLTNATVVGETEPASLIWDAARQLVFNGEGQRMAEGVGAGQLQYVVDRRRLLEHIIQMSAGRSLSVRIHLPGETAAAPPGVADVTHRSRPDTGPAEPDLMIMVSGVTDGHYFAIFNLTGGGEVQLLDPHPAEARAGKHQQATGGAINPFGVKVAPPFGAEHVIVVAGQRRLNHLMPAVVRGNGQFAAAAVLAAFEREAAVQPLQAGYKGIYTTSA